MNCAAGVELFGLLLRLLATYCLNLPILLLPLVKLYHLRLTRASVELCRNWQQIPKPALPEASHLKCHAGSLHLDCAVPDLPRSEAY